MPNTRRRPNAVASQATAGAMKICEPIPAVESQAPSSNPSEKVPRRSGNLTVVKRLSKFARNAPSSTAPTANNGRGPTAPREIGPWPAPSLSAIALGLIGVDSRDHRHPRQQAFEQWLVLVEFDPDGNPLHHLGEIAGRVVRRQQRELRSAGGRNALDMAVQPRAGEAVDRDIGGLARLHPRQLRLLV